MAELGLLPSFRRLEDALREGGDASPIGAEIFRRLREGRIPEAILASVTSNVRDLDLWRGGSGLIVRSSATVEDSKTLSFAGIFESIRVVETDELESAIRAVWASAFHPRSIAYVQQSQLREMPRMGVAIQSFLEADWSGVMFTRFGTPGKPEGILVEYVEGGCEKLVSGEVTPSRVWIYGDGLEGEPTGLAKDHIDELARLAATLEADLGGPQDVEWCILEGRVHLLQSRPITTGFHGSDRPPVANEVEPMLTGVAASPGIGTGPVHLVFNIEDALRLPSGSVLVTPMTNPDMVVAMRNSAGIVTDVGGMICHAAIVSRELGLPCVVGTETATRTLSGDQIVSVDGSAGGVYEGALALEAPIVRRPAEWPDLWNVWGEVTEGDPTVVPAVSSADALSFAPSGLPEVVLIPDVDLRCDEVGLWRDLEGIPEHERRAVLARWLRTVGRVARGRDIGRVIILPAGQVPRRDLERVVEALADPRIRMSTGGSGDPVLSLPPHEQERRGRVAVPLGMAASLLGTRRGIDQTPVVGPPQDAIAAALDTLKFFGHMPDVKRSTMPDPRARRSWWRLLPEYGRFHDEHGTLPSGEEYEWLEVRPELVISPLLKSLVQPGFEMAPRILRFRELPPMHIKWIRGRYHFRGDVFGEVWPAIVRSTWDAPYMADLMRRVRASYRSLEEVLDLFPDSDEAERSLTSEQIVALITSWWPRWVEFFSLCWFIQAQGDDIIYPFIEETVQEQVSRLPEPPGDFAWPGLPDFSLPTTPVISAEYMADVGVLREMLDASGLSTVEETMAAIEQPRKSHLKEQLREHLRKWFWVRDRDLVFEPWDTPERVIETVLKTGSHRAAPYSENLQRTRLALSFHFDMAMASGREGALNHSARFFHDLTVERENHHLLWLKYSYPLRRLFLEVERRFIGDQSLRSGDVFFLQAPELIEGVRRLPDPLLPEVVTRVRNRRAAFLRETRLGDQQGPPPEPEDDYY